MQHQTPPPPPPSDPWSQRTSLFALEPMSDCSSPGPVVEALLKRPGRILYELQGNRRVALFLWLVIIGIIGMAAYGVVVGTFSGGAQVWIAPAKIVLGTVLSTLICLPSLYIFACLAGVDARLGIIAGALFAMVALTSLLLIGFAPIVWIFSQSTDSMAFMSSLHLLLWAIAIAFGLRFILAVGRLSGDRIHGHMRLWNLIFVLVCLQMTTTLRPIIGKSDRFLPGDKKFFLAHWMDTLENSAGKK